MKTKILLSLVFAMTLQCFAKNDLQPYQKAAIATRFASEVKYNFAGYDKFAQNYDSICRAILPLPYSHAVRRGVQQEAAAFRGYA